MVGHRQTGLARREDIRRLGSVFKRSSRSVVPQPLDSGLERPRRMRMRPNARATDKVQTPIERPSGVGLHRGRTQFHTPASCLRRKRVYTLFHLTTGSTHHQSKQQIVAAMACPSLIMDDDIVVSGK